MNRMIRRSLFFVCLLIVINIPTALGSPTVSIDEWQVPWPNSRPRDPYVAPDGSVWFVGQTAHYAARFDPQTETFQRYNLDPGSGPHNNIVDSDGFVWYAGNRAAHIGRLDPKTGAIDRIPMTHADARDPHTLVFDDQGNIWFTVQHGNLVGRLSMQDRTLDFVEVPTRQSRPYGIEIDSRGTPWIVLLGTNKLATVDPDTLIIKEIELPRSEARPRRIGVSADDSIWYVDYAGGYLGRYEPSTGTFREWPAPAGSRSAPYAMSVDDRGRPWFVETGVSPNRLVGFNPDDETFTEPAPIPSGGGTVRHMVFHADTATLWFGADTNTLGRATIADE